MTQYPSAFGNHMFCEFLVKIYDACAGPVKGGVNRIGYASSTIDSVMPPGVLSSKYGNHSANGKHCNFGG